VRFLRAKKGFGVGFLATSSMPRELEGEKKGPPRKGRENIFREKGKGGMQLPFTNSTGSPISPAR